LPQIIWEIVEKHIVKAAQHVSARFLQSFEAFSKRKKTITKWLKLETFRTDGSGTGAHVQERSLIIPKLLSSSQTVYNTPVEPQTLPRCDLDWTR